MTITEPITEEQAGGYISEPNIEAILGGYKVFWSEGQLQTLTINVKRIQSDSHGGITGEMSVWFDFMTDKPTLSSVRVNLLSERRRIDIAKRLQSIKPFEDEAYWRVIIEQACHLIVETHRAGDPGQMIEVVDSDEKDIIKPEYILEPLIVKGLPTVIYGDKGMNKTTLAILAAGTVYGWEEQPFFKGNSGTGYRTGLLDYESSLEIIKYTTQRLRRGTGVPYFDLFYRHCHLPVADDLEAIAGFIERFKIDVLLIDSLGAACGGDLYKPEPALRFFSALRSLNRTSLIIAQNTKGEDNKKTIFGSAYFTYYSRNIFEIKLVSQLSKDKKTIALEHKEANYSGLYDPIGFNLEFTPDTIKITPEAVTMAQLIEKVDRQKQCTELLESGPKSTNDIAAKLKISRAQADNLVSTLRKKNLIITRPDHTHEITISNC